MKKVKAIMLIVLLCISIIGCKKDENAATATKGTSSSTKAAAQSSVKKSGTISSTVKSTSQSATSGDVNIEEPEPEDDNEPEDEDISEEEEIIDLNGRTILWGYRSEGEFPINSANDWDVEAVRNAEKKYNCKFQFFAPNSPNDMPVLTMQNVLAGVRYCDVFRDMISNVMPKAVESGALLCVDDYVDVSRDPNKYLYQWEGKSYGIYPTALRDPFPSAIVPNKSEYFLHYNYDIMEREGVTNLVELLPTGQWTWDTFLEVAQKVTRDLNGDGAIDQYGIEVQNYSFTLSLLWSNDTDLIKFENGIWRHTLDEPKTLRVFDFINMLYNNYKVIKSISAGYNESNNGFTAGTSAMYPFMLGFDRAFFSKLPFETGVMPMPKGPDATKYSQVLLNASQIYVFPSNIEEPKGVILAVAEAMDSDKISHERGIDMDSKILDTYQSVLEVPGDEYVYLNPHKYYDIESPRLSSSVYFTDIAIKVLLELYNPIVYYGETLSSAVGKIIPKIQEMIDVYNN